MTTKCATCEGPLPAHYPACPKDRPWQVSVDMDPTRTFGHLHSAEGYALNEVAHRGIGTRAVIRHRRWGGTYMTLERMPSRRVAVRLNFIGEQ